MISKAGSVKLIHAFLLSRTEKHLTFTLFHLTLLHFSNSLSSYWYCCVHLIPLSLCFCCYHRQRLEVKENVMHEKVILSSWSLSLVTIIAHMLLLLLLLLSHFSCVRLYNPTGQQPIRPFHPWNSPGNNTGAGCHFLLQCIHAC